MPRTRDVEQYEAIQNQILDIARRQMAENGTAGIGLRAIAREMDITAPAIYRYFPRIDDLITALILQNFNALADAMEAASLSLPTTNYVGRLEAVLLAYRRWALDHSVDFQLIYGNPIPGYVAPAEQTMPAARRGFDAVVDILGGAYAAGLIDPPEAYYSPPEAVANQLEGVRDNEGYDVPLVVVYLAVVGWTRIHGLVILELLDNVQPIVGDPEAFYVFEIREMMKQLGVKI